MLYITYGTDSSKCESIPACSSRQYLSIIIEEDSGKSSSPSGPIKLSGLTTENGGIRVPDFTITQSFIIVNFPITQLSPSTTCDPICAASTLVPQPTTTKLFRTHGNRFPSRSGGSIEQPDLKMQ